MGDSLFYDAKEVVAQAGKASASLLQRRLKVGYARAARLLDLLEERGIIGPGEGAKPREVYIGREATPREDNFIDDGTVAEVASADEKVDDPDFSKSE
jgi:S-DNA-T family DNA segregation ATPase FtsK/SpoIIIE